MSNLKTCTPHQIL